MHEFVEMMVVDGCFIIELFRKHTSMAPTSEDDPVSNMSWTYFPLSRDLLLLENQLPWQVLESLWNLTKTEYEQDTLPHQAHCFFCSVMLTTSLQCNERLGNKHLLDFLRNCLLSSEIEENKKWNWDPIPCATELVQAGVKFEIGDENDLLNIKFNDGVMEIPPILIQETTKSLFRNLIAFEQCDPGTDNPITYYAEILDFLINSSKDVDFLRGKGRGRSAVSTEDIAGFFNGLYNGACIRRDRFSYRNLCHQVNNYYKAPWQKWQATLRRDYFNRPWALLSLLAGIFIFVGFTFTQTLFSILSYYNPSSQP